MVYCAVTAHASVQTGETWKATAVKCLWNRRRHSLGEKYTKNSFSAKVKLACYKSQDVFTHTPPVSFTLVWINKVWFLDTAKKPQQTKICHYKPHEKAFWPDTGNAGTSCCVLDWWRTWNSIYIYLEKYFTCVCALPHSQNTKSMPGYRKTFSSHLKYSPQIML